MTRLLLICLLLMAPVLAQDQTQKTLDAISPDLAKVSPDTAKFLKNYAGKGKLKAVNSGSGPFTGSDASTLAMVDNGVLYLNNSKLENISKCSEMATQGKKPTDRMRHYAKQDVSALVSTLNHEKTHTGQSNWYIIKSNISSFFGGSNTAELEGHSAGANESLKLVGDLLERAEKAQGVERQDLLEWADAAAYNADLHCQGGYYTESLAQTGTKSLNLVDPKTGKALNAAGVKKYLADQKSKLEKLKKTGPKRGTLGQQSTGRQSSPFHMNPNAQPGTAGTASQTCTCPPTP